MRSYTNKQGTEFDSINSLRQEALSDFIYERIGHKILIMTSSFPFLFIGIIKDVVDDVLLLHVETTSIPTFENKDWFLHIDFIEVFYIEEPGEPKIPKLVE